jgi:O-antigen/teichoic acid export membrane protein
MQCALTPLVAVFYGEPRLAPILYVMALQFLVAPLGMIPEVLLQRKLEYKKRSLIEMSSAIVASVVTLLLALSGAGVWSLVLGNLAGVAWRTVTVNIAAPFPHFPLFSLAGMRSLLGFGSTVVMSRCLWTLYMQMDVMIIGRVLGGKALGIYSVAMHLASLPVQRVTAILNQVAFPALARFQEERELIRRQLLKVFSLLSLAAFPVSWGMSATANEIVLVLLGENWQEAIFPLRALTLIMPFRTLVAFLPTVTDAIGRPQIGLQNILVSWIIMPPAFYIGCQWGITGVATAWLLAFPLTLLINAHRMLAAVELSLMTVAARIAPAAACGAVMFVAVEALRRAMLGHVAPGAMLVAEVATGALVYGAATWTLNRATLRDVQQMFRK